MELTTINVQGRDFKVSVDERNGYFSAQVRDGVEVTASSLADLREKVSQAFSRTKTKIDVPYMVLVTRADKPAKLETHHITGKHGANGNWLIKTPHGSQQERYLRSEFRVLTPDEAAELCRLSDAAVQAQRALTEYARPLKFEPTKAATIAWREAQQS